MPGRPRDPERVLLHLYAALFLGFLAAMLLDTFVIAVATQDERRAAAVFACVALALWDGALLWATWR